MLHIKKKIALSALTATICLSGGTVGPLLAQAADVTETAEKLMAEYPDMIAQWKTGDNNLTDSQIKSFVNEVTSKVQASGEITEDNIGQKFNSAFNEVFQEGGHDRAILAAVIAFKVDPTTKKIPEGLQPMKEVIKKEVLGTTTTPSSPGSSSGGGGGGGGGSTVTTPSTTTPTVPETETVKDPAAPVVNPAPERLSVFVDIKGHWAEKDVLSMHEKGIIKGANGKANPDDNITRAEFAAFLVNALNLSEEAKIIFKDADPTKWYYSSLSKAYHAELIKGYGNDTIRPNELVTREQMAVMIHAAIKAKGLTVPSNQELQFKDKANMSPWALEAVTAASSMGIINGFPDQSFNPKGKATHAQALVMISRLLEQK